MLGCLLAFGLLMQTGCDESTEQELTEICFWHSYTDNQQAVFQMLTDTYNSTEGKKREEILKNLFAEIGEGCYIKRRLK